MAQTEDAGSRERLVRIGAMADLHCSKSSQGQFQPLLTRVAEMVDVLLLTSCAWTTAAISTRT